MKRINYHFLKTAIKCLEHLSILFLFAATFTLLIMMGGEEITEDTFRVCMYIFCVSTPATIIAWIIKLIIVKVYNYYKRNYYR